MSDLYQATEDAEIENRKRDVFDLKNQVTSKISEICRFIGLGLVALFYAMKTTGGADFSTSQMVLWYVVGVSGGACLLLDYLHYFAAYRVVRQAIDDTTFKYDQESCATKFALAFFHLKQWATLIGAAALIILVVIAHTLSSI